MPIDAPKFQPWGIAAVHLLRGVVYSEDEKPWNLLLSHTSTLEQYFARLGLRLVVHEAEGMAYLRQFREEEQPDEYAALPKLFRAARLSYGQTLVCVLLRDELRRFEEEQVEHERCVVEQSQLLDQYRAFFPEGEDEVKQHRDLGAILRKLEALGFVRSFAKGSWEVRRILKARLPVEKLEALREQLASALQPDAETSEDAP